MMSTKKTSKKKKWISKTLKWTGISFFLLLITLILIPFFFKEQLKNLALREANKMLKADVGLGDFDLTFISTFPNMTLSFEDITITGRNEFEGVKLVDIKRFDAHLGFWSVISGSDVEISSISLIEPKFDVRILENGLANYDIVKSDEELQEEFPEEVESAPFRLGLNHYEIIDGYIRYDDRSYNMFAELVNLNHAGDGDLTADVIDFNTLTSMDKLTYKMDGLTYLSEVNTDMVMNILMEFKEGSDKYTLRENELRLNNLSMSFDGYYEMFDGYDDMDIVLKADRTTFKDLLSLIPTFYQSGYESMVAKGDLRLGGFVKGRMDERNMPAFDFSTSINNASINYPEAPSSIDDIRLSTTIKFPGGDNLDRMTIDVSQFHASFVDNTIDATLQMRNPMSDPYLKSGIVANIDLATLDQVIPMDEGESYNGKLVTDLLIDGRMSSLENEDYESFKAEGSLQLTNFHYESKDLPDGVDVNEMLFLFSPKMLSLQNLEGKMAKTDFKMKGGVDNYMGYLFRSEPLKGTFDFHSEFFDLDAFMPESSSTESSVPSEEQVTAAAEEAMEPILIPSNIDFVLDTYIGKMIYDGLPINNLRGKVVMREEEAILENLSMNTMGGSVGLSGKYSTQNKEKPSVNFSYSLKDIDIQVLSENFNTVERLAPVTKHARGKISSDFTMNSLVTPSFEPIYNSLGGSGSLLTSRVQLENLKAVDRLAEVIDIEHIRNATFDNLTVRFEFSEGRVNVRPFVVNLGNIRTEVEGWTSFEQEINYRLKMNVPKSEIPKEILQAAERAVAAAQNIPGFKMKELPAVIPVNALMTNTVTDPKIQTDFREQLMALGGDVKGAVKDLIDETVQQIKDTVRAVIEDKVEDIKEDLLARKKKIMDDAQKQADRVVAEAKVLADRTRQEGETAAQKLINEARNPIERRAAEVGAERIRKEAEEKAQRIEREAQTRSDNIMKQAREQADRLE